MCVRTLIIIIARNVVDCEVPRLMVKWLERSTQNDWSARRQILISIEFVI